MSPSSFSGMAAPGPKRDIAGRLVLDHNGEWRQGTRACKSNVSAPLASVILVIVRCVQISNAAESVKGYHGCVSPNRCLKSPPHARLSRSSPQNGKCLLLPAGEGSCGWPAGLGRYDRQGSPGTIDFDWVFRLQSGTTGVARDSAFRTLGWLVRRAEAKW